MAFVPRMIKLEDRTIARRKGSFAVGFTPEGYAKPYYQEPDEEYYKWIEDIASQFAKEHPPQSLFVNIHKDRDSPVFTPILLSDRWNVHWQYIKKRLESRDINPQFIPTNLGYNEEEDTFRYYYSVVIPLTEVLRFEEQIPELKSVALYHEERKQERIEEERKRISREHKIKMENLIRAIEEKGMSIEKAIRIISKLPAESPAKRPACPYAAPFTKEENTPEENPALPTPVNAGRWRASVAAACAATAHAVASGEKWVKQSKREDATNDFHKLICSLYQGEDKLGPLVEAEEAAWGALPNEYKQGPGALPKSAKIETLETLESLSDNEKM